MDVSGHIPPKRELATFFLFRVLTPFFYWVSSKVATLPTSLSWQGWQRGCGHHDQAPLTPNPQGIPMTMPPRGTAVSVRRKRKPSEFHSEITREKIRATLLVERLRAHALGEIDLSPTQIRVAEILLRKVIPGFRAGWVLNCGRHRGERFGTDAQKQYDL
jgi:hypothetical protein